MRQIDNARDEIDRRLQDNPSLKVKLDEIIAARYPAVRRMAMRDTGLPLESFLDLCPFATDDLLDQDFWPD